MRVFRLSLNGVSVPRAVEALLGFTGNRNQADVLVVAPSKAAAWGLANGMPSLGVPSLSDPEFRLAMGNDVDALAAAGQLDRPRVLAYHPDRQDVVVEVHADGRHLVVGRFVRVGAYGCRFEPAAGD